MNSGFRVGLGEKMSDMTRHQYYWFHITSQTKGEASFYGTKEQFLESLNRWNASNPGVWQYWY
jgi:hypothetical protein